MAPESMFAIRKLSAAAGLTAVQDLPVPELGENDVLIEVAYAGLCGTDRHIYDWDDWSAGRVIPPVTLGHEFSGTVVEVGSEVTALRAGTRVSAEGHIGCRACKACRTGNSHICERLEVIGIDRDGAFATYIAMPADNVWPLSDDISLRVASVMDPLGNAMHTVMSADVTGKTVMITGVGVIGLMATAIARHAGAHKIIAVDLQQHHLDRAAALGADHLVMATDHDAMEQVRTLTQHHGAEVWLEMSGAAAAIATGFTAMASGATVAMLGLPKAPVQINLGSDVILRGMRLLGISGRRMFDTWFQMQRFLDAGNNAEAMNSLITHCIPSTQFEEAFATHISGNPIKVIMNFREDN